MGTYGQFCPVAKAAEVFAERWTPLIIRELMMGSHRFNDLERGLPRISRSLLADRLRSLERAGLVLRRVTADGHASEYRLTRAGEDLGNVVELLGRWGQRWVNRDIGPEDLDPALLVWDMRRRIYQDRLPERRVVVQIDFTGARRERYWLLLHRREVSVCRTHPGFDVDLVVTADTAALHRIWVGHLSFRSALQHGLVQLDGPTELVRAFPEWLRLSYFARVRPAAPQPQAPAVGEPGQVGSSVT